MGRFDKFCEVFGLHPLVGFGMFATDWMLFSTDIATGCAGLLLTVPVGLLLSIPSILIQRHAFKDDWGTALGKGLLIGVLTAIPTALPSILTLGGGVLGTAKTLLPGGRSR
ncbi:MAG: hypothetical protein HC897_03345 [Thermoanaerobaculia bacterium]|nr:hypothetical protein [Thermoanaerobaculia bacterium]